LRVAGYITLGIVTGLLLATLAILLLTRTEWGHERSRRFAVAWLADRIHGELQIGRVTSSGLLGGVKIHDFRIIDPRGRPFVRADSVELEYNWRTLLAGEIVMTRAVLHQPEVILEQLPGDTIWNYENVFADTTPQQAERGRSLILFRNAQIRNGTAVIRTSLRMLGPVAAADTARILIEDVPGGLVRVLRFEAVNAQLSRVIWETPVEPGQLFDVASVSGRAFIQRDPVDVRGARGTLTARDTLLAFDFTDVTLPASQANVLGTVVQREGKNILDIRVEGRRFQFTDLQWLYPKLPDEGGGSAVLRIQSQPGGTLFLAEDARIQAPGTRLAGTVGVVTGGDSVYFTRVNLRASPLDVQLLEQLLPGGLPVEGLLIGTVEVSGPISALETSGDLRLDGGRPGGASAVAFTGVFDLRGGDVTARSLRADVSNLELALFSALSPRPLDGRVSGRVEGSGGLDQLAFRASLTHDGRGGGHSSFEGGGNVRRQGGVHAVDITADATSATFADLAQYIPALERLQGEVSGPVRLAGTSRDLRFDARLETAGGPVAVEGRMVDDGGQPRVTARARGESFHLSALLGGTPQLFVTGALDIDVTGTQLASARGTARLTVDSMRLREQPLGALSVGGHVADGMFAVDSARLDNAAGVGRAHGTFGLVEGRSGELTLGFTSASLAPLEPFLFDSAHDAADEPRLDGRIEAAGTLSGWIGGFDLAATAHGESLLYGDSKAERMYAELDLRGLRNASPAPVRFTATGNELTVGRHPLQSARLDAQGFADSLRVAVTAAAAGRDVLQLGSDVVRSGADATAVRLTQLQLGGKTPWTLAAPATVHLERGAIRIAGLELNREAGGRLQADGVLAWASSPESGALPLDFRLRLDAVPFPEMLRALRSEAKGAGELDATLRIAGTALDPLVEGELNGRELRYDDMVFDHVFAELNYAALGLDTHAEMQAGGRSIITGGGRIPVDLRLTSVAERRLDQPLRFTIAADSLPPALPLGLLNGFTNVSGRIDGSVAFSGTTRDPALGGGFRVTGGAADWDATGVRYRDVNGSFTLERDRLLRVELTARTPDPRATAVRQLTGGVTTGSGTVKGTLDLTELTDPVFDLRLGANHVFAAHRRDAEAAVTGEVRLGGRYSRPEVTGDVRIDQGALYLDEIYRQFQIVSLDDVGAVDTSLVAATPLLGSVLANARNPFLRNIRVDSMDVRVGADSWLRSQDMDVEVTGDLTVAFDRREEYLRLTGTLNVERGTYTLYYPPLQSRRFAVRQGTIEFPGVPGIDPSLSITAAYRARAVGRQNSRGERLDILAVVSGTLQSPRVHLSSDAQPPISESDLASYLFFGVPSWQVGTSGTGPIDVGAFSSGALKPTVLGYASSGLQTLGQSVGLDYAALTSAEVAPEPHSSTGLSGFLAGTQLELGTYLGSGGNFFVGYSQPLGTTSTPAVRLEWRFLPEFTLEMFAEDRFARTPGFGIMRTETGLKKVYGLFLFREWGF
jgi:hypothetical protein